MSADVCHWQATIGKGLGIRTTAVISDMSIPLGRSVGHSLEVIEACECLRGKGPQSLRYLVTTLGTQLHSNCRMRLQCFEHSKA